MKVAVINFSGNVGKTMIAMNLLSPRMGSPRFFDVESINIGADSDGLEVERYRGKKFGEMVDELIQEEAAIVDVGASNVEDFIKLMQQFSGSHEEFDYFVVPVVKEKKVQKDTINTVRALQRIGVEKKRIRLVFNKVDVDESVEEEFPALFGLAETEKSCIVRDTCTIYANEVYERLKSAGKTLGEIMSDDTDYRAKLRETSNQDEKEFFVKMVAIKRLAITANKNLDEVYKVLFK